MGGGAGGGGGSTGQRWRARRRRVREPKDEQAGVRAGELHTLGADGRDGLTVASDAARMTKEEVSFRLGATRSAVSRARAAVEPNALH